MIRRVMGVRANQGGMWVVYDHRKTPIIEIIRKKLYSWLEKLLKHNKYVCQISLYGWRNDERAGQYKMCCNDAQCAEKCLSCILPIFFGRCDFKLLPKPSTNSICLSYIHPSTHMTPFAMHICYIFGSFRQFPAFCGQKADSGLSSDPRYIAQNDPTMLNKGASRAANSRATHDLITLLFDINRGFPFSAIINIRSYGY